MAEVGVLNLTIHDNSEKAAEGLDQLAGALGRVQRVINTGVDLSGISTSLSKLVSTVTESKSLANIGTFLNAVGTYSNAIKKIKKDTDGLATIDTNPIKQIQAAIGDGIKIGNAGTQLASLREALAGDWKSTNATEASTALQTIADGVKNINSSSITTTTKDINALADSLNKMAAAVKNVNDTPGAHDYLGMQVFSSSENTGTAVADKIADGIKANKDTVVNAAVSTAKQAIEESQKEIDRMVETGGWGMATRLGRFSSSPEYGSGGKVLPLNLQLFGGKGTKNSEGQIGMNLDGLLQKTTETTQQITDEYKQMTGAVERTPLDFSKFMQAQIPLNALGMKVDEVSQQWQRYGSMVRDSFEIVQKLAEASKNVLGTENAIKQTIDEETNARNRQISQEVRRKENQENLESNYSRYRELFLSGENPWITRVPEKYNLPAEAIKQAETYAEAVKIAMQGANKETSDFAEKTSQPTGNLMKDTAEQANNAKEEIKQAVAAVEEVKSHVQTARHDIEDSANLNTSFNESKVLEGLSQVSSTVQTAKDSFQGTSEVTRTLTGEMIGLDDELKQKKHDFNDVANSAKNTSRSFSELMFGVNGLSGGLKKAFPLLSRFTSMMKTRAIRYVIRKIAAGFSEGVQNVYQYSKLMGTELAPAMDQAATALQQMKNSIGAAVAPAIQALVPVLQTLVNWFINLVNYANQFLALISGQNYWTRALPEAAEAFEDSSKKAKGASKAMKDLLADWDELNIIQSQTGGSGGSKGKHTDEEYKNMFERVEEFNETVKNLVEGIKEQFGSVWNVVKKIGVALLGWKFSKAFGGLLGVLGGLVAAGAITDIVFNLSIMYDKQYAKTGEKGWLIADVLTTALGSFLSGKAISKILGTGMGLVTAGITFAVSAGATFGISGNVEDESKKKMLLLTGAVESGIAGALAVAGFIAAGVGTALSFVGGIATIALVTAISYSMTVTAEKAKEYDEMAKEAFKETGKNGIDPDKYISALQTELKKQTTGASLVIEAYMEVPTLQNKLFDTVQQINSLNAIISGEGKLSKTDAKAFKENWGMVLDTLDRMSKATYDTILQGLNNAMLNANKEISNRASELRVAMIAYEKQIDEETASMYKEVEDIVGRIANGKMQEGDLEKYDELMSIIAIMTNNGFDAIEKALKKGEGIDFSSSENPIEDARKFLQDVKASVDEAVKTENEGLDAEIDSIEFKKKQLLALMKKGTITESEYKQRADDFNSMIELLKEDSEGRIKQYKEYMVTAYNQIIKQAIQSAGMDANLWERNVTPLIEEAKKAGWTISDDLLEALKSGLSGDMYEVVGGWFTNSGGRNARKNLSTDDIIASIKANMESSFNKSKKSMPSFLVEAVDMFKLTGWDLLTNEAYQDMYLSLVEDLGKKKADIVWEGLNLKLPEIDTSEAEKKYKEAVEKAKKEAKAKEEEEKAKKEAERAKQKVTKQQENNEEEFNRQGYNEAVREAREAMHDKLLTPFEENMLTANLGPEFVEGVKEQLDYVFHDGVPIKLNPYFEKKSAKEQILDGLGLGNINLNNRKVLHNDDGSISTEYSTTIYDEDKGKHVLIPTIVNGVMVDIEKAIEHYFATGEHLGEFDTPEEAGGYALDLHKRQEWFYGIMEDLKKFIDDDDGLLDATERISMYDTWGQEFVDAMLDYLNTNPDGSLGSVFVPEKIAKLGAAGVVGGMSPVYRGGGQQESGPDVVSEYTVDVGSSEEDNQALITGVTNGVKTANGDVVSALNVLAGWLQRIYNKDNTVVVQPSTSLGRAVGRSNSDLGRVTGYAVD